MNNTVNDNVAEQSSQKPNRRWRWLFIGGGISIVCAVGLLMMVGIGLLLNHQTGRTLVERPEFTPLPTPVPFNQIAYIDNDNDVWLITPDGSQQRQLTTDGLNYRQPIWSPDNSYVAYIGDDNGPTQLYASWVETQQQKVLYSNPDTRPFYLYWAPDSQSITFLAQGSNSDMAMYQTGLTAPHESQVIAIGQPFYWVWSPGGDRLLMHVGGDARTAHVSLLDNQPAAEPFPLNVELDFSPGRFQPPIWSSDNRYIFYAVADGKRRGLLHKTDTHTLEETVIARLKGPARLILSPDNRQIFFTQFLRRNTPPFGMAYLMDADGDNQRQITELPVASAYWSPDGRKIALLTLGHLFEDNTQAKAGGLAAPLPQKTVHRWWVYDVQKETLELLKSFTPTTDFSQTIDFYDQYHHSLTFWSPDSRYFLLMEQDTSDVSQGTVWVIDSRFEEPERELAKGTFAVWSWR